MAVDGNFLEQRVRFNFKGTCEHCMHFDEVALSCTLTYPTLDHREAHQDALKEGDAILFCKTFQVD